MKFSTLPLLIVAMFAGEAGSTDSLSVTVAVAEATVRPAVNGQLRLPALEIETTIRGDCAVGSEAVSLSLSSADSVQFVDVDTVGDDGAWHTVFSLPARQVPPLADRGFCPADTAPLAASELRKHAFVSLRVGLRCSDGENEKLTTRTALVDVNLVCRADDETAAQDSSE